MGQTFTNCCDPKKITSVPNDTLFRKSHSAYIKLSSENRHLSLQIPKKKKVSRADYIDQGLLGEGGFGKVFLVKYLDNNKLYALKEISKEIFTQDKPNFAQIEEIFNERNIMKESKNPFIVRLVSSFQDDYFIYFVMEFMEGGSLFSHLRNSRRSNMSEDIVRFYASEVILALEYLHEKMNVIYRDLKPENILTNTKGHIKLADFGLATKGDTFRPEIKGTPGFIAPEIYKREEYGKTADYYSLGCLIYEMVFGQPVFSMKNGERAFKNQILMGIYMFPSEITVSKDLKDFIKQLLEVDPQKRLGFGGINQLKTHPWLLTVDWKKMEDRTLPVPLKFAPMQIKKAAKHEDLSYMHPGPPIEKLTLSPVDLEGSTGKSLH